MVSETCHITMILKHGRTNFIIGQGHNFQVLLKSNGDKFGKVAKNVLTKIEKVCLLEKVSLDGKSQQYLPLNYKFAHWIGFPRKVLLRIVSFNQPA